LKKNSLLPFQPQGLLDLRATASPTPEDGGVKGGDEEGGEGKGGEEEDAAQRQ
jgi:hypothetical protein